VVGVQENPEFESGRSKILLPSPKRPDGTYNPPSLLLNGCRGPCPEIKRPGHDVNHSPYLAPRL
jgi:hypothetical protein